MRQLYQGLLVNKITKSRDVHSESLSTKGGCYLSKWRGLVQGVAPCRSSLPVAYVLLQMKNRYLTVNSFHRIANYPSEVCTSSRRSAAQCSAL